MITRVNEKIINESRLPGYKFLLKDLEKYVDDTLKNLMNNCVINKLDEIEMLLKNNHINSKNSVMFAVEGGGLRF